MTKFIVEYTLAYDHVVRVGIEAEDSEAACEKAEALFEDGSIWDDSAEVPLLYDDYEEQNDNTLEFKATELTDGQYPEPASCVIQAKETNAYRAVARAFLKAYAAGANGGSIEMSDLDDAWGLAVAAGLSETK